MTSASVPLTNVGSGYTIVTQVLPSSTAPTTAGRNSCQMLSPLQKFLKGEPKALGAVEIMIGVLTILFGIVMSVYVQTISVYSGVVFWGSLIHITAGSLTVSASNKLNLCVVKGALVMNILSTIAAGIAIIMLSLDLVIGPLPAYYYYDGDYRYGSNRVAVSRTNGISGVVLVFSLLQFTVSIAVSAFSCKATCSNEPALNIINVVPNPDGSVPTVSSYPPHHAQPLNIINVVPNPEGSVPVVSSFPPHHAPPGVGSLNAVATSALPLECPPAYTEKSQPLN